MEKTSITYLKQGRKKKLKILFILLMTIILSFYALNRGAAIIAPKEVLQTLLGKSEEISNITIWNIRLPRIIGGLIVGAGLGVAGNIMQTCLGNPLASPSTLGIPSAAAFEQI